LPEPDPHKNILIYEINHILYKANDVGAGEEKFVLPAELEPHPNFATPQHGFKNFVVNVILTENL
jgi:hypothetical protein